MSVRSFFDTNVLIYADDDDTPAKQWRAQDLYATHRRDRTGVASVQVLQEYFVTATKKLNFDPLKARRRVQLIAEFDIGVPDTDDILAAIDLHRLHGFSFWDSLIIQMAQQTGCKLIYSEDLQHAQNLSGLKIVNPFV